MKTSILPLFTTTSVIILHVLHLNSNVNTLSMWLSDMSCYNDLLVSWYIFSDDCPLVYIAEWWNPGYIGLFYIEWCVHGID